MEDQRKTKAQLINELAVLREKFDELLKAKSGRGKTEEKVQEGEERPYFLMETGSEWIWEIDRRSICTYSSPMIKDLLGYEPEDVVGKKIFDLMPTDEAERMTSLLSHISKSRKPFSGLEIVSLHKDGRRIALEISGAPVFDKKKRFLGYKGAAYDFAECKYVEKELRATKDYLRTVFNNVHDAIFVHDLNGRVVDVNDKLLDIYRVSREDATKLNIVPDYSAPENSLDELPFLWKKVLAGEDRLFEWKAKRPKDGSVFDVEVFLTRLSLPEGDFVLANVRDISERKRVEAALRESEEKFRFLFDTMTQGVVVHDAEGVIIEANRAACHILGLKMNELLGRTRRDSYLAFIGEDGSPVLPENMPSSMAFATGKPVSNITLGIYVPEERHHRWILTSSVPRFTPGIEIPFVTITTFTDITARKQTEAALRESEEKFRGIAGSLPGIVFQYYARDDGGRGVYFVSERSKDVFGVSAHPLQDFMSRFDAYIVPEDRKKWHGSIEKAVRSVGPWSAEVRFIKPPGEEMYIRGASQPRRLKNEVVWNGILFDITARKRAEKSLREAHDKLDLCVRERTDQLQSAYNSLAENERLYRNLFENASIGMFQTTIEGNKFLRINRTLAAMLGYDSPEEVMSTLTDIVTQVYTDPGDYHDLREALKRDEWYYAEQPYFRKDGSIMIGKLAIRKVLNSAGATVYLEGIVEDVTERKRSEEALRQAEAKYRAIFENAVMGIYQSTPDGRYVDVNSAFARTFGYDSPREMIETVTDIGRQVYANPEDRMRLRELLNRYGIVEKFETQIYRKDGTTGWISINARAVRGTEGAIVYFEGTIEDISARRQAEEELRITHQRLFDIIEFLPDATFVIDEEKKVVAWNLACEEMTGVKKEEIMGKGDYAYAIPFYGERRPLLIDYVTVDSDELEQKYMEVKRTGNLLFAQTFVPALYNGKGAFLSGNATPLFDRTGKAIGAIESLRDITEFKRLENQLLQAQKLEAIGTLAGGIAHDFNNILTGIVGFAEMVKEDTIPDTPNYHRLGLVLKGAYRGRDLVRQILTFSRQTDHEQKPVALGDIVGEGLKLLRPILPTTVEIRLKNLTDDDTILADPAQIHQVLMNLCTNSAHAMKKKGGLLEIGISRARFKRDDCLPSPDMKPGDYVILKVRDTGCGMKPEVLERIFDPFFTTKAQGEGTGLGLSVVHGIVKSHGGTVKVESEPGKGTAFSIYLPKIERQTRTAPDEAPPLKGGEECILFVDDEDLLVELNHERLTRLGYEVVATTSSIEALELFSKEPRKFHLVITDYTMPHMTGVDLAKELLKVRKDIPIILCTGHNDSISADKAKKLGIREFLLKPISQQDTAGAIRRVLDAKPAV
jgi:PAS domain S-box-containing protein